MADTDTDTDRQSEIVAMDAAEYKQKRRLRRILDAHDEVEESAEAAYGKFAEGTIAREGLEIRILKAVQKYIREAHGLLMEYRSDHDIDEGAPDGYWIRPEPIGKIGLYSQDALEFDGLRDILYAQEMYHERWQEVETTRHGPDKTVTLQESHTVPEQVSLQGYLLLNRFLTEERDIVGINFEDDSKEVWGFSEAELEGDDGREVI
jgi:hypothetical protein